MESHLRRLAAGAVFWLLVGSWGALSLVWPWLLLLPILLLAAYAVGMIWEDRDSIFRN